MEHLLSRITAWILNEALRVVAWMIVGAALAGFISWFFFEEKIEVLKKQGVVFEKKIEAFEKQGAVSEKKIEALMAEVKLLKASSAYSIPKKAVSSSPKPEPDEHTSNWPPDLPDFPVKTNLAIKNAKYEITVLGTFENARGGGSAESDVSVEMDTDLGTTVFVDFSYEWKEKYSLFDLEID